MKTKKGSLSIQAIATLTKENLGIPKKECWAMAKRIIKRVHKRNAGESL